VDFDARAIAKPTKKAQKQGFQRVIEARIASASHIEFIPDASADFVLANRLLCFTVGHLGA